jgi:hypothetical protein
MGTGINQFKPVQQSRRQTIRAYCPNIFTVSKGHIQKKKKKKASVVKQPSAITVIEVVRKPNGHYDPPVSTESSESSSQSDSDSGRKSSTLKVS